MNELERAVIEAARKFANGLSSSGHGQALIAAVNRLEQHEKAHAADGVVEVDWATVAEGDGLRSRSGTFYRVVGTKREWKMGSATGKFLITVQLPIGPKTLARPSPAEPRATVRRGATGKAVDQFVHVFSSGDGQYGVTRGGDGA